MKGYLAGGQCFGSVQEASNYKGSMPHGADESQKRELQVCYRLLLDLRDGLENTKFEPPA